jgi:hypothetical protein
VRCRIPTKLRMLLDELKWNLLSRIPKPRELPGNKTPVAI